MKNYQRLNQVNQQSYWAQSCNNGVCSVTGNTFSLLSGESNGLSSVSSVNNKKKRPWSNFSYVKWRAGGGVQKSTNYSAWLSYSPTVQHWYVSQRIAGNSHYYTGSGSINTQLMSDAIAISQAKLLSSMKEARNQWNAAVSLGEGRETARHIARTASRLYHGFVAFKRGDLLNAYKHLVGRTSKRDGWEVVRPREFLHVRVWSPTANASKSGIHQWAYAEKRGLKVDTVTINIKHERGLKRTKKAMEDKSFLDDISNAWMELSFAWRPLLKDIDEAARFTAERRIAKTDGVYRFSRRHNTEGYVITKDATNTQYPAYATFKKDVARCRYTCEVRMKPQREVSLMSELGFTDPATVAWNLLPLSFVVDWFVNVGQVLESLHEFKQWTPIRCIRGRKGASTIDRYLLKNWTNGGGGQPSNWVSAGRQYLKYEQYSREVTSLPTSVPLRIKITNPFDLKNGQMATLGVLLRFAFTGTRPSIR